MPDYTQARKNMVDCQVRPSDVTDLDVISAMLEIPREHFVSEPQQSIAYIDEDILLNNSSGSVPRYMMEPAPFARLLQLAEITPQSIVLDIGCASGYSTAVIACLCSSVVALEQDEGLARIANEKLADLEIDNAVVLSGAHEKGYGKEGPYDAILIEGSVSYVPEYLIAQLKEGGRLVSVEGTGNTGKAVLYTRNNTNSGKSIHFNCAVWPLPGFSKSAEFVF